MISNEPETPSNLLRQIADDDLMYTAHKALEDILVEWRDIRLSTPFVANGLVVKEKDGKPSATIRLATKEGIQIALRAIADRMSEE
jgi:hypothetical protein